MKILIVEDSVTRVTKFKDYLFGHTVIFTSDPEYAIKSLSMSKGYFDVLFLDHDLSGTQMQESGKGTGQEVAEWVANNLKNDMKVFVHSYNEPGANNIVKVLPKAVLVPGCWNDKESLLKLL